MKKTFSLTRFFKFAAIITFSAMLFAGCGSPTGGDNHDNNTTEHQGEPGGNGGQGGQGGQGGPGGQGGQGGPGGNSSLEQNTLTDTTWFYKDNTVELNACTHEHKTESGNGGSNPENPHVTIHTVVREYDEDQNESKERYLQTQYYLHVDKNNNAYVGKVQWYETFSRTWKDHVKVYDNGYEQRTEIEGSSNKTITQSGDKVYETFAVGKVKETSQGLEFTFDYSNTFKREQDTYNPYDPTSTDTFTLPKLLNCYASVYENTKTDQNDNLHNFGLLNERNYVTATNKGSSLELVYKVETKTCNLKTPSDTICGNIITNKSYSTWTKTDFKEEMLDIPEIVDSEKIKDKEFIEVSDKYSLRTYSELTEDYEDATYGYYCFKENEVVSSAVNYWGHDYFFINDDDLSDNAHKFVISEYDGKYYLAVNNYSVNAYEFKKADEGKEQGFKEFKEIDNQYSPRSYKLVDKVIKSDSSIYDSDKLKGNKYQYQKDFIKGKEWYKQAALWSDSDERKLECKELEKYGKRKGYQKYELFGKTVNKIALISNDKYIIPIGDESYILEDKKDETIKLTDQENNSYTLTFQSRLGYNAENLVDVVLNFENTEVKFPVFESKDSTYKLPQNMSVAELKALYKKVAGISRNKDAVVSYTDKGQAVTETYIKDLTSKTLYLYAGNQTSYNNDVNIDDYLTGDEPELNKKNENGGQQGEEGGASGAANEEECSSGAANGEGAAGSAAGESAAAWG